MDINKAGSCSGAGFHKQPNLGGAPLLQVNSIPGSGSQAEVLATVFQDYVRRRLDEELRINGGDNESYAQVREDDLFVMSFLLEMAGACNRAAQDDWNAQREKDSGT